MPAGNTVGLDGQRVTITDPLLKSVTIEFDTNASVTPGAIPVNVLLVTVLLKSRPSLRRLLIGALLAGRVAGVPGIATGATSRSVVDRRTSLYCRACGFPFALWATWNWRCQLRLVPPSMA